MQLTNTYQPSRDKKKQVNKTITKEAIKIVGNKMYSLEELRQHLYDCVGHFKSNHAVFHKDVDEWIDNNLKQQL